MAQAQVVARERHAVAARTKKKPAAKKKATSTVINLRVDDDTHALIESARATLGQNRTEFMLESARVHAQEVLLGQTYFSLGDDDWDAFNAALEAPPPPTAALKALMASTPPWAS